MGRIREIVRKEFRQALREPRMRAVLAFPPIMQLLIFGFAVNLDVDRATLAWMDKDRTPASRELRAAFEASGYFHVVAEPLSGAEIQKAMDRGKAQAAVTVPPGFARDLDRAIDTEIQILVEGRTPTLRD
jgi:ABC-2 type transport system permease protein